MAVALVMVSKGLVQVLVCTGERIVHSKPYTLTEYLSFFSALYSNVSEKLEGHPTNQRAELVVSRLSLKQLYSFFCSLPVELLRLLLCKGTEK